MAQSYSARSALAICTAALIAAGCGGPKKAPVTPATTDLVHKAEAAERQRQYDRARALYREAIGAARDNVSRAYAGRKMALALIFWGEYEAAESALVRVVTWRPDDVASWHDLGIVRHKRERYTEAEAAFRRSIQLRPNDPRSRIALAALLAKQRKYTAALVEYRALMRLELPSRLRSRVQWAIGVLERKTAGSGG